MTAAVSSLVASSLILPMYSLTDRQKPVGWGVSQGIEEGRRTSGTSSQGKGKKDGGYARSVLTRKRTGSAHVVLVVGVLLAAKDVGCAVGEDGVGWRDSVEIIALDSVWVNQTFHHKASVCARGGREEEKKKRTLVGSTPWRRTCSCT